MNKIDEFEVETLINKLEKSLRKLDDVEFFLATGDEERLHQRLRETQILIEEVEKDLQRKLTAFTVVESLAAP